MTQTDSRSTEIADGHWPAGVVVASGRMNDGGDGVALWHVDEAGRPTGAWIVPQARAYCDRVAARQLLALLERRAVTGADVDVVAEVLGKLTVAAEADLPAGWWGARTFTAVGAVADVVRRREQCGRTVAARRGDGRAAAPLRWERKIDAAAMPRDHEDLRRMARFATAGDSEVASEAVAVVAVLGWVLDRWRETEQVKNRRRYVLDAHGPIETLPPSWAGACAHARDGRFPW